MEWTVVVVLTGLIGLFATVYKLFFQPIQMLDTTLQVLTLTIQNMTERDVAQDLKLNYHDEEFRRHDIILHSHDKWIERNTNEINYLKDKHKRDVEKGRLAD